MPPLGLWYLGAQLEAQGHTTEFRALDVSPFYEDGECDQVWVSATSPQMYEVRKLSGIVKDWTKTKTVFGGAAPWARPATSVELDFDLIVAGEGDHPDTVRRIVEQAQTCDRRTLLQPAITKGGLEWVLPPIRRWDEQYHFNLTGHDGIARRATTLFTSRGCPMACAFCESGRNGVIWDKFVRYEPVATVDAQLKELVERGHGAAQYYDDIMPLNRERTLEIMKLMQRYGLIWRCFIRTDVISKQGGFDYLRAMAMAGLVEVLAGVESADNRIKDNIHKGTTIEQDTQVLAWCKQLGIRFKASFILGLPGEDADSLARTREWILTHRPDRADVNALIPFPGTPITREHDYQGNPYDVQWSEEYTEEFYYKGAKRSADIIVSTSHVSSAEIKAFRDKLILEMDAEGIPF